MSKPKKIVGPFSTKQQERLRAQWEEVYLRLKEYRQQYTATVDVEGCGCLAQKDIDAATERYQILVSLMLSSQTKDTANAGNLYTACMRRLQAHGLTIKSIQNTSQQQLADLIHPVSFFNNKAKNIKKVTDILAEKYNYDTPRTYKEVLDLPGIGPKMALLFMYHSFNEVHGISVDTHVHRISNWLGWANSKTPEQTRTQLESFLPERVWGDINSLLVGYGQTLCRPVGPKCDICVIREFCPTGNANLSTSPSKKKKKSKSSSESD